MFFANKIIRERKREEEEEEEETWLDAMIRHSPRSIAAENDTVVVTAATRTASKTLSEKQPLPNF